TIKALESFAERIVLIAGGKGKGQDFTPLADAARDRVTHAVVIGEDGGRIAAALASAGIGVSAAETLASAIQAARGAARAGAGVLWAALRCDYRWLEKAVVPALLVAVVLLVLVLVPPIGQAINGTRRWIRLGPVSFQPVELAKLALVLYLAAFLAKKRGELEDFRTGVLPPLLVAGLLAGLVLVQPDLGNCMTL